MTLKNGFEKSDKNRKVDSWEISRYIIVLLQYLEGTWKMERVNKNGCNEHQPSKSQEAAPCAETIENPFF